MTSLNLDQIPLLARLSPEALDKLSPYLERLSLAPGAELFQQGDQAEGLYFVVEGQLRVRSRGPGPLGSLGPGAALGAFALVGPGRREASANAETEASVLLLRTESFVQLSASDPRTACDLLAAILADLGTSLREDAVALAAAG